MSEQFMTKRECDIFHKQYEQFFSHDRAKLEKHDESIAEIALRQMEVLTTLKVHNDTLNQHAIRIAETEAKAGKKWETMVMFISSTIIGGLIMAGINAIISLLRG